MEKHHALVYIADSLPESAVPEKYKIQSVDVAHVVRDRLGIDDVRKLIATAAQAGVTKDGRVFVIVTQNIPVEAQNALLKLFEEPPRDAQFLVVIPDENMLIPTLRSRVQVTDAKSSVDAYSEDFTTFLGMSQKERMDHIASLAKAKSVSIMTTIVNDTARYAAAQLPKETDLAKTAVFVQSYFGTPGASKKMLLEELALSLPRA